MVCGIHMGGGPVWRLVAPSWGGCPMTPSGFWGDFVLTIELRPARRLPLPLRAWRPQWAH